MSDVRIDIMLDPVKDGLVFEEEREKSCVEKDLYVPVIATDGQTRLIRPMEFYEFIDKLGNDLGILWIDDGRYMVFYSEKKTLKVDGSKYFVGSFMVVKGELKAMKPLTEEEIHHVQSILESRMTELRAGWLTFSALEVD